MRKQFFIPACIMSAAAVAFVIFAMGHPEASFPFPVRFSSVFYGVYVDIVFLLFILSCREKFSALNIITVIFELGAIFFLVQSIFILNIFPRGHTNWFLPLAITLNLIAVIINSVRIRIKKRKEEKSNKAN